MAQADLYDVLGVDRSVGAAELKSAYRKLAKKYHPDVNPGDEEAERRFKEVSHAYDILKDDQSRAAYDQFGHAAFENGGAGAGGGGGGFGNFGDFGSMGDIFEEFFGGGHGRGQQRQQRGNDLRADIEISLEEAFTGVDRQINLTRAAACGTCSGSGAARNPADHMFGLSGAWQSARSRAFSWLSVPVINVRAAAKSLPTHAAIVAGAAIFSSRAICRSLCRPGLRMARGYACRAKAMPAARRQFGRFICLCQCPSAWLYAARRC